MTTTRMLFLCVALLLAIANLAGAAEVELYNTTGYVRANTPNQQRAQLFSPTTSSPNSLLSTDWFCQAGFKIKTLATDNFTFNLGIYSYSGDPSLPLGTLIAERTGINRVDETEAWEMLTFSALPANASYVLLLTATAYTTQVIDSPGWRMLYNPVNDGGPGNDAYSATPTAPTTLVLRTDREFQVKLVIVPEPGGLLATLGGLLGLAGMIIRRKR